MKQKNNIDQFFKDKLDKRAFVLEDTFITDLETKLDLQVKTGFFWWKSLLGILLVGMLFFTGFYYLNNENSRASNQVKSAESVSVESLNGNAVKENYVSETKKKENISEEKLGNRVGVLNSEKLIIGNEFLKKEIIAKKKTGNNSVELNKFNKNSNNNKTNLTAEPVAEVANPIGSQLQKSNLNSKIKEIDKELLTDKKNTSLSGTNVVKATTEITIDKATELKSETENLAKSGELKKDSNTKIEGFVKGEEPSEILLDEKLVKEEETLVSEINPKFLAQKKDNMITEEKDSASIDLMVSEMDTSQISNNDSIANIPLAISAAKAKDLIPKRWTASVFGGISMISKNISGNETASHYAKREEEEADISTINYGIEVGYFLNKNINFSTGLNKLTYGEDVSYLIEEQLIKTNTVTSFGFDTISVFSHNDSIVNLDSLGIPIDTVITPVFVDQTVNDTINTTTNDTTNVSKKEGDKNRYTYIQIPIMIGYKMQFNRIGVNLRGGIVYSRLVSSNGRYISSDNSSLESLGLKKNIFSIALSTELSYKFSRLRVFIDPKYQFNITNIFPNSTTDQKYKAFGVSFGIGMEF